LNTIGRADLNGARVR